MFQKLLLLNTIIIIFKLIFLLRNKNKLIILIIIYILFIIILIILSKVLLSNINLFMLWLYYKYITIGIIIILNIIYSPQFFHLLKIEIVIYYFIILLHFSFKLFYVIIFVICLIFFLPKAHLLNWIPQIKTCSTHDYHENAYYVLRIFNHYLHRNWFNHIENTEK